MTTGTTKYSFPKEKIKICLSEKISPAAREEFEEEGYSVTEIPCALEGDALAEVIEDAHVLGVRSRSDINKDALSKAKRLLCIGCFTVGTDQVDLESAQRFGIPVFNAPHSSTRSVAELTIGCIISLSRKLAEQNLLMHQGKWLKSSGGSFEVRNKAIGIIGYGHIGQQVGILAEAFGMQVRFYDVQKKLPLGRAIQVPNIDELLRSSDFVSLHVPATPETWNMINSERLSMMRKGSFLINHSRGQVVDIEALASAVTSGYIRGAALDVFPEEPQTNDSEFLSPLVDLPQVLLTPHIGGSTSEAQINIGKEVAASLISFLDCGSTEGAVNFPKVNIPAVSGSHRILHIHKNVPGVLSKVNQIMSDIGANIERQYLATTQAVGYLIMDINSGISEEVRAQLSSIPESIKTRILF